MSDTEEREKTGEFQTDDVERQRRQEEEELNKKLLEAAERGNNEDVIQHISGSAEITSRDSYGDTGLHLSADRGHMDVMQTFLTHKLDISEKTRKKFLTFPEISHLEHFKRFFFSRGGVSEALPVASTPGVYSF